MKLTAFVLSLIASPALIHAAILIDNFSSATNDRFANDPQFIANSYNLSGISIANDGRWVTMISENVFLSAHHFFPANGTSVTFYGSNDPAGTNTNRTIQKSERIGSSDIRIGTLDTGLGSSFSFYDFATQDTNNNNTGPGGPNAANSESFINSPYYNADAYLFGRSESSFAVSQDMAVGRNKLDTWVDNVEAAGTTDDAMAAVDNILGDTNYLQYEAFLQVGDSGAPMMVDNGSGSLTIVGMNWFVGTLGSGEDVNGFSYVGNYDAEIQAYIDANPVPERRMSSFILGLTAFFWICGRRNTRTTALQHTGRDGCPQPSAGGFERHRVSGRF